MKRLFVVWLAGVALLGFEITAISLVRAQTVVETAVVLETQTAAEAAVVD